MSFLPQIAYGLFMSALQQLQMAGSASPVVTQYNVQDNKIRRYAMFGDSLRSKQYDCCSLRGNVSYAAHLIHECLSLSIARWV